MKASLVIVKRFIDLLVRFKLDLQCQYDDAWTQFRQSRPEIDRLLSLENRHYRSLIFNREVLTRGNYKSIYELAAKLVIEISFEKSRYRTILFSL